MCVCACVIVCVCVISLIYMASLSLELFRINLKISEATGVCVGLCWEILRPASNSNGSKPIQVDYDVS